jgi:3-deoxy-manno-octulosonate cytidylyltransferase (CMP-KDO synthetase)
MMVVAVIPARYGSTRLPAKVLADIHGKPMVQWVVERTLKSKLCSRVVVATDDPRIESVVRGFGAEAILTSPELVSGTDRVAAVARMIPGDVFVNVQGDEPLIDPEAIDRAVRPVLEGRYEFSTLRVALRSREDLLNPNVVKVLVDDSDRALYFSRHPIPYSRMPAAEAVPPFIPFQHVGLYVYRRETLLRLSELPPCDLERAESLEQLRALQAGIPIGVMETAFRSVGVDSAEDLETVRKILRGQHHG